MNDSTFILLVALFILGICREMTCWYLKINETLSVLKNILKELQKTNKILGTDFKVSP
jgi:hypothetical protein